MEEEENETEEEATVELNLEAVKGADDEKTEAEETMRVW